MPPFQQPHVVGVHLPHLGQRRTVVPSFVSAERDKQWLLRVQTGGTISHHRVITQTFVSKQGQMPSHLKSSHDMEVT